MALAGARVLPTELAVARAEDRFDADGRLVDPATRDALSELVASLVDHHREFAAAA